MRPPFEYTHYRPLLRDQATSWKKEKPGWTLHRIAEKAGVQAPYLTNVLKERAHLSADQLFSVAQVFGWGEEIVEFAALLQDWERSGSSRRRDLLKARIDRVRKERLETKANLKVKAVESSAEEFSRFFLNPYYSLLHSFLSIPRFARDPASIRRALPVSPHQLKRWLSDLVQMKFIHPGAKGYEKLRPSFHLPKESPVCEPHLNLMAQIASQQLQRLPEDQKYNFAVTFSADPATREKIQREFLKFLQNVEPLVKDAAPEELYGLRFDLFSWSYEGET